MSRMPHDRKPKRGEAVAIPAAWKVEPPAMDARKSGELKESKVGTIHPLPEQKVIAEELCRLLNVHIGHDGYWRCVWVKPATQRDTFSGLYRNHVPTVMECQWCDADGDVQFVVEIEEKPWAMLDIGVSHWVENCEEAYSRWKSMIGGLELNIETQTHKAAQGEAPKSGKFEEAPTF